MRMRQPNGWMQKLAALAAAGCITLGQSVRYDTLSTMAERENIPIDGNPVPWALLCILLAVAIWRIRGRTCKQRAGLWIFAAMFGFLSVCAQSLYHYDSFEFLTKNGYQFVLSCVCMASYACLYQLAGRVLFYVLDSGRLQSAVAAPDQKPNGLIAWARRHTRLAALLCILLCWLPWMIAFYPGVVTWDMFTQMQAAFGTLPLMDDHPVVSTWIMGGCMRVGLLLGSGNLGAFFYMLLQTLICAFAFGCAIEEMGRLGCSRWLQGAALLFFALMPVWPMYARMGHKDFLFTGVCLLFTIEVTRAVFRGREAFAAPRDWIRLGLLALLTCLLRKNGLAVVLPSAVLTALFAFSGKQRLHAAAAFCGAVALYAAFQLIALPAMGIPKGPSRELYSIPFQQTARYLRDHGDDVAQEDGQAVDTVLDAQRIADLYVPVLSDPVKATFRGGEMTAYLRAWLRMGMRDPTAYFAALLSGNYGYYLFTPRIWYNDSTGPCFWYDWEIIPQDWQTQFGLTLPDRLAGAREAFRTVAEGFEDLPLAGLLYQNALYAVLTWLCTWYLIRRRNQRYWIAAVPSMCTFLLCFGMPVNACLRYFLPVVASAPLLLAAAARAAAPSASASQAPPQARQ